MKKLFTTLTMLIAALMLGTSCEQLGIEDPNDNKTEQEGNGSNDDKENNGENQEPGEGEGNDDTVSNLTPGQHKQRLEEIGIDFLSYFEAEEHQELADAIIALSEYFFLAKPDTVYNPDEEYSFSAELDNGTRAMMTAMLGIAQGSPAAMVEFATRAASEDFIIDANEYGGMSISYDTELDCWVEGDDADDNEIKASWPGGYAANVTWSNSSKIWEYTTVDDVRYRVYVPSEINFAVTADGKKLVTIAVQPKLTDNFSIAPDVTVTIPGGFVYTVKSTADPKQVNASVVLAKDGKKLLTAGATVAINDFTDPDNWYYENDEIWEDEYGNQYYDIWFNPAIYFTENAKNGQFQVDLLELSIVGMGDFRAIFDKFESFDDDWESEKYADAMVKVINEKAEVKLFYNDTKEKVCNVVTQKTKYTDEYGEWNGSEYVAKDYYSFEPIMLFPDGSKYAFESYFTSNKFQNLIEAFEKLVEDYEALLGDNF